MFVKQTRILPQDLKKAFIHLEGNPKKINIPGSFVIATNPGVEKTDHGYLLVYRAECTSLVDFLVKQVTFNRNKKLGLCCLDSGLNVIGQPIYLKSSAPNVAVKKQSPNDPRLIRFEDKIYAFYNDRFYCHEEKKHVRQVYMCDVSVKGFGEPKPLVFDDRLNFTEKGQKFKNIEKNWSPFVFEDNLYLIYLIDPHVVLKLDVETGQCSLIAENQSQKIWDFGIARGGTPCLKDKDRYITFFHSPYPAKCLGHSHPNAYIMGAYAFSAEPPFEIIGVTKSPLCADFFYSGLRKFIFPTALVDDGQNVLVFYGRDDKEMWSLKVSKDQLYQLLD